MHCLFQIVSLFVWATKLQLGFMRFGKSFRYIFIVQLNEKYSRICLPIKRSYLIWIYYSFDVRKKNPQGGIMEGAHWSAPNSFGGRAFFRAERNISYLLITNVTAEVSKLLIVDPKTCYYFSQRHNQLWQK